MKHAFTHDELTQAIRAFDGRGYSQLEVSTIGDDGLWRCRMVIRSLVHDKPETVITSRIGFAALDDAREAAEWFRSRIGSLLSHATN